MKTAGPEKRAGMERNKTARENEPAKGETRVKTDRRKKKRSERDRVTRRNRYYRGRVYASTDDEVEVFCKCHGRRLGTGLATAVSINNQPRDSMQRWRASGPARFCIFSRNRAGKLWLLTPAPYTVRATYFRLENNEPARNSTF